MNYRQIADLYREDMWGRCTSNKVGTVFELLENYSYDTEIGQLFFLPKGTRIRFVARSIATYHFTLVEGQSAKLKFHHIGFGKSRLLQLKLKEIAKVPSNTDKEATTT